MTFERPNLGRRVNSVENHGWVYVLRGSSGRCYLGSTNDLERRLNEHRSGHTHSTKRLGSELTLVAARQCLSLDEARYVERMLKGWKNSAMALAYLRQTDRLEG